MNMKEAAEAAQRYVADIFGSEKVSNLSFEEGRFDKPSKSWLITVGFTRPWQKPASAALQGLEPRTLKVVVISDADEALLEIRDRSLAEA